MTQIAITGDLVKRLRKDRRLNRMLWYTWYHDIMNISALRAALAAVKMQDVPHFDLRSTDALQGRL